MKKTAWTAAAFLAAACMASAPAPVSADDLRLPSGEVLPLGDKVTVWRGSDSYFAGKLNGILEGDDFEQSMAQAVIDRGVYKESERAEAEQFAKETAELWRDSRVYQLRSVSGNTMYTAFVLSLPIDTAYWQAEAEDHRWEEYTESAGMKTPETAAEIEAVKAITAVQQEQTAEGVSKGGLHWRSSSLWLAPEQYGWASPMYLVAFSIEGTDEEHLNITVVYAGQASGKYFEPFLAKALENAEREAAK